MRPYHTKTRWIAVATCLMAISSVVNADEGVARIPGFYQGAGVAQVSATGTQVSAAQQEQQAAYLRIRSQLAQQSAGSGQFQQVGFQNPSFAAQPSQNPSLFQQTGYSMGGYDAGYGSGCGCNSGNQPNNYGGACGSGHCGSYQCGSCQAGQCQSGPCGYGNCQSGRNRKGRKNQSCDSCYSDGYNERLCTLFARATPPDGCTRWGQRWWRGQTNNYTARNQKLANCLFGWMVPSGCCGQGCPPFGKYHVTYANDPGYAHAQDGQVYGAQGYGTHMSVPLAPNVRQSYNYSWGTPASRITPIGQYAGPGPAAANTCQSW